MKAFPTFSALVLLSALALPGQGAAQAPDHFTCYRAKTTSGTPRFVARTGVSLVDRFWTSTAEVRKPKMLCAPTNKNGEDPNAPSHPDHLEDYQVKHAARFARVQGQRVVDQFGTIHVDVTKPVALQVPTAKSETAPPPPPSNPTVDHFQCYKVRPSRTAGERFTKLSGVTLEDQFGAMTVEIVKPQRLCAPVNKNGEDPGAEHHPDHLMCYRIAKATSPRFVQKPGLFVANQFGEERLDARKPIELCVPARVNPPAGATASPTPSRTPTPGTTGTPSLTRTPTPTVTATPGPNCGNNTVDAGEECDGSDDAGCPGRCTPLCTCADECVLPDPIPEILSFVAKPGIDLDTGWTGQSHDLPGVDDGSLTAARLSNCDLDTRSPTCGQCNLEGPVLFPGGSKNCQCLNLDDSDESSLMTCDPEMPSSCTPPESCECFYGPPLPLSSGAVPVCVTNRYTAPFTGTANIADLGPHAGEQRAFVRLRSSVHNAPTVDQPCPVCVNDPTPRDGVKGGTCSGGPKNGRPCDVSGSSGFFGAVSFDCPPTRAATIGKLDIIFNQASTGTTTLATAGVKCTASGFQSRDCWCDTCATAAGEPCNSNADCPDGVACGGRRCVGGDNNGTPCTTLSECPRGSCARPGQATAPNQCSGGVCSPDPSDPASPDDGVCRTGPFDQFCSIERFRGCAVDADCSPPNCATCKPNQVCSGAFRQCFLDPIVRTGMAGTQMSVVAATFCIPPTASAAVNGVAGLPGPGGLLQPTRIFRSGAQCGNGVLNSGEACDPPQDGACPGECLPNCRCPICGDHQVNQPGEQCDGVDDGACPGQCQPDCSCAAAVCGNDTLEFGEQCDGTAPGGACPASACQADCTCGPFCGNGTIDAGEQCDGPASGGACPPSACQADCTCGPFCGNGTIDAGEQCDGTATGSCDGTCQSDCTCAPFCGNNQREAGEVCDGSDAPACPGECQADCSCPSIGELAFVVTPGADLDTGWTGTSHDFGVQAGSTIAGEIGACDGVTDFDCTFFGNVGSFCSGDPSRSCTDNTGCTPPDTCVINTYGPPLPLSSGGVPVCVANRFSGDVTGTYNLTTGAAAIRVPLNSLVHISADVSRPCPICDCGDPDPHTCQIGESGFCDGNPVLPCTVQGTGPFGPTSNDCPPNPASNVSGSGLNIVFEPATTGTASFASNQPCTGPGFTSQTCWCSGQTRPNGCNNACDGGSNDNLPCAADSDCPGTGPGACKPLCRQIVGEEVGEGQCSPNAGPIDQRCAGAPELGCSGSTPCPPGLGPCVSEIRRCFLDPIVREGVPGTTANIFGATFCIPATTSPAVNNTAGLPGPGAIRFPNAVSAKYCGDGVRNRAGEQCDGADDANCPGVCQIDCKCPAAVCGNDVREIGEQCDGSDDAACPGTCQGDCTCPGPSVCGDGFVSPGEQCDPGGPGGVPPPSDTACPGDCNAVTCQCPLAVCGNGVIESPEACELPGIGCGPLQLCVACLACAP